MYITFLSGPRKGETAEMKFLDARALIEAGRAEPAYQDRPAPLPPITFSSPVSEPIETKVAARAGKRTNRRAR
jgi:hypothetical protein